MAHLIATVRHSLRASFALGVAWFVAGCGTATGLDWVDARPSVASSANEHAATTNVIPATAELEPSEPARPRLNHTVTLGEIDVVTAEGAPGGVGAPGTSVTINNYNVMNASTPGYSYGYAYPGVGYGRSVSSFSAGSAPVSRAPGLAPGQSWPTISDHGPSFPYRSGPASPWGRAQ